MFLVFALLLPGFMNFFFKYSLQIFNDFKEGKIEDVLIRKLSLLHFDLKEGTIENVLIKKLYLTFVMYDIDLI